MTDQAWLIAIGVGALFVNLIGAVIGGTWVLSKSNEKLLEKIDTKIKNERISIDAVLASTENEAKDERKEIDTHLINIGVDIENSRKWFGEGMAAIREKITQTELWNRDNFVSKSTFGNVIKDLKDFFTRFEDKLDLRFNRLESKIDDTTRQ